MTIDIYTHFVPARYADALARKTSGVHPDAGRIGDLGKMFPNLLECDSRLAHMDKYGVSLQVLTPLPLPVEEFMTEGDEQRVCELVRLANDSMAEIVARRPDRFVAVALLAFQEIGLAVEELVRAVRELSMKGAMLFTNINGRPLDWPELFPIYEKAVELDVPLWVHPVSWNYYEWIRDFLLWQIFGWPFDTTLATARLVYSGVLEKFPRLKLVTHHSGGVMPYLSERIRDIHDQTEEFRALYSEENVDAPGQASGRRHPLDVFRMFYTDVALSGSLPALRCSYAFFGARQLVFGTDYPFSPEQGERFIRANLAAVNSLEITTEERTRILAENAKELLHLS